MNQKARTNYRWVVTSLIFFITLVNFIDRSAISFVIEPLKKEFGFTDTQFGLILSAFGVGYVLLTAFGGWLVDVWGARIVWPLAAVTWSLCVAFLGFAGGFWSFIWIRFMLGVTEGPHFPAMSSSISNWLTLNERARALSLGLVAIPLSSCIGAPITSYLVANFGWRAMFFIISIVGILWAGVWYWLFTDRPQDCKRVNDEEKKYIADSLAKVQSDKDIPIDWRFILTHPALIANNIAYFAFGYMLFFATLWLPGYFLHEHNLNLKSVGWYLTIPWLVGAVFLKMGGVISDSLYKKTGSGRIARSHLIWVSQALAAFFFVMLSYTTTLGMSIFCLSLGLGFGLMSQPAFFSVNIDIAKERAGSSQGITSSCLSLAGIIAPVLTGWLIDQTGNYQGAFLLLAGIMGASVLTVIFLHHPDRSWAPSQKSWLLNRIFGKPTLAT
ncbi:MAG: MFS transporter [Verrucomicrobia bacterium]|nr:MFS transporter [Verrucomicrobiota bacterium]MBS0637348.1 MFS transporter [Verrucomicrobiota bacterium]